MIRSLARATLLAATSVLLLTSCADGSLTADTLAETPTSVEIAGHTITIIGFANRDFQLSDVIHDSLLALVQLDPSDAPITVGQMWVIHGEEVWETMATNTSGAGDWSVYGGPKWPIGDDFYIVAELRSTASPLTTRIRSLPDTIQESH
jgi:hypothetical protein